MEKHEISTSLSWIAMTKFHCSEECVKFVCNSRQVNLTKYMSAISEKHGDSFPGVGLFRKKCFRGR